MATLERILTQLMLRRRRDVAFDLTLRLPQERYAKNIRKEVIEFKCAFEQQQIFASSLRLKMKQQTNKNRGYHLQYKFGQYATRRSFNLRHIVIEKDDMARVST